MCHGHKECMDMHRPKILASTALQDGLADGCI
jgi:hypothetical protein